MIRNLISRKVSASQIFVGENFEKKSDGQCINSDLTKEKIFPVETYSLNHLLSHSFVDFTELYPFFERVILESEDLICEYGEIIRYVYFPETSVISEYQILDDGRTTEIAMIGREGVTGLEVVLDSSRAKNWMRISVPGNALRINSEAFLSEFNYNILFRKIILNYINSYIEQTSQRIICNCYHLAEMRFCSWLLMLQDRSENESLAITHEQISQFIGTQRATVSRIMQILREKKIIKSKRGRLLILDRNRMEQMACSCYEMMKKRFLH